MICTRLMVSGRTACTLKGIQKPLVCARVLRFRDMGSEAWKHMYSLSFRGDPCPHFPFPWRFCSKRYNFCFKMLLQMACGAKLESICNSHNRKHTKNHWIAQWFSACSNGEWHAKTYIILVILDASWCNIYAFAIILHETLLFFALKCCPNEIRPTPLGECTLPHLHLHGKPLDCARFLHTYDMGGDVRKHHYCLSYFMISERTISRFQWIPTKRYLFCFKKVVQMTSDPLTLGNAPGKCIRNHWFAQGFCDSSNGWRRRKTYTILVIFDRFWTPIGALEQNPSKVLQFVL